MSCLKPEPDPADNPGMPRTADAPEPEQNEQYTQLVQKSYDQLFEPWLKSDEDGEATKPDPEEHSEAEPAPM